MKSPQVYKHLKIDEYSVTPKYLQLSNSILKAIEEGSIEKDDLLPSINELSFELEISRDTVEKGYGYLKKIGVLGSVPGKGYFIQNVNFRPVLNIFLLFNKLSVHKKILYDSFVKALGDQIAIDFYIYNNDYTLFKKLIQNRKQDYSHYVIIPHFFEGGKQAADIINMLPREKLLILDKKIPRITGEYASVYENFEKDIYHALKQARRQLGKYHTLKIIFPEYTYHPVEILDGFHHFCQEHAFSSKVVRNIAEETIKEGEVYISLMEDDLVVLIEKMLSLELKIGEQVGVISYNETPLKKIILNGITTISTDFQEMGKMAAQLILTSQKEHVEVPFHLTLRASL